MYLQNDESQTGQHRRRADAYYQALAGSNRDITPEALKNQSKPRISDSWERPAMQRKTLQENAVLSQTGRTAPVKGKTGLTGAVKKAKTQQSPKPTVGTTGFRMAPSAYPQQPTGQVGQASGYRPYPQQPTGQMVQPSGQISGFRMAPQAYPQQPSGQMMPPVGQASGFQAYPQQPTAPMYQGSGQQAYSPYPQQPSRPMMQGSSTGYPGQSAAYQPYGNVPPGGVVPPMIPQGNGNGGRKKKNRVLPVLLLLLLLVLVVVIGTSVSNRKQEEQARQALEASVTAYNGVFCDNVYVDGISLAGMTPDQARSRLLSHAQEENSSWYVNLTYNGDIIQQITSADLNITFDVEDALNDAWAQGHTGTIDDRYAAMATLKENPYHGYTAQPSTDASNVDTILRNLQSRVYKAPQDAYLSAFIPAATDPFQIQEEVPGVTLDIDCLR